MRKQRLAFIASILVLAVMGVISLLQGHAQKASGLKQTEPATPVQEGVMTDRQKEHSKLYENYKGIEKLTDLIKQKGDNSNELSITIMPGMPELSLSGQVSTPEAFLKNLAAESDAIVVGSITDKSSQLTENGTFIFTDYDVVVEDVLKNSNANNIQPHSNIVVTRPGGRILLQGRPITARDKNFKPFVIGGRYLLFLKYIPATNAYHAVSDKGSFEIVNSRVELLTEAPDAMQVNKDAASFIDDVRRAVANVGSLKQGDSRE